uniref:Acetolactate synthase n=1 Tax=Mallomonas splendens TaxID=52552 RepID=A0A3G2QZB4_9STRA|nr:acetohydroxyacid synthase large subunit [Mallomonas splendens]AYO28480.1 acetohydroxyacid synthase large subunit [Mallomonas splendens]
MNLKNNCTRTGAYILLDSLVQNGVEHIFGYPGGAILPIYDELYFWEKENLIKHILVRHEQGAVHAADAYARSTNKPGICFATSGPGATNLVTGIANARMDSIPLIIITGQVGRTFIGTDAFQETDIFGITLPIVKHSYTIRNANELPKILSEAFFLCQNGRPGPILIDIPKDVGLEETQEFFYQKFSDLFKKTNYRTEHLIRGSLLKEIISKFTEYYQPLFYIGGGVIRANAFKSLQQIVKIFQIPLTTTLMGKSCYNEEDHLNCGMLGMHGSAYANFAVSECDLLITLGARFDDRVTGKLDEFACNSEVIHFDIDPAEISKNRCPQKAVIGDLRKILLQFLKKIRLISDLKIGETTAWLKRIYRWKETYPLLPTNYKSITLSPQETISLIGKENSYAFFSTDVGQHQMWAAQLINCQPKKWITSAGLGTMGFGLPAAIGAKIANPNQDVICISGDSSFQMNIQELGTVAQYQLNIQVIIINNGWQGMVRQWQESFYGNRYSNSYMKNGMPEFAEISKAYGLLGYKINTLNELKELLPKLKNIKKGVIIDVNVIENENCYPMVSPGKSNSQMIGLIPEIIEV